MSFERCSLQDAGVFNASGKRYRRKNGKVEYMVHSAEADQSYERAYNFTNYFVKLMRVSEGSTSRPVGSIMTVSAPVFHYEFTEVS